MSAGAGRVPTLRRQPVNRRSAELTGTTCRDRAGREGLPPTIRISLQAAS